MADGRYFTIVLIHDAYAAGKITTKLNEMDKEGWRPILGWSVANAGDPPASRYTTTLVFENERHHELSQVFEKVALDIEASRQDPLRDGGALKWQAERAQDG